MFSISIHPLFLVDALQSCNFPPLNCAVCFFFHIKTQIKKVLSNLILCNFLGSPSDLYINLKKLDLLLLLFFILYYLCSECLITSQ